MSKLRDLLPPNMKDLPSMSRVRDTLQGKGYDISTIDPDATVFEGLQLMAKKDIGALVVMEKGALCGIFSERDYARNVILKGRSSKDMKIRELMTTTIITIAPDESISQCMKLMTDNRIRHLPVVENGSLIGILSIGDVVKRVISEQARFINDLENYITGKNYSAM